MVTTFNPPSRPKAKPKAVKKKKKLPLELIVLGAVCVALLIGVILLNKKSSEAAARADALNASVLNIAGVVGSEEVTAETLADPEGIDAALTALNASVAEQADEVTLRTAELEQARAAADRVQAELDLVKEAASDAQDQARITSADLSKREAELKSLQQQYDRDVARLKEEIAELKKAGMNSGDASSSDEAAAEDDDAVETAMVEEEDMMEEAVSPEVADDMADDASDDMAMTKEPTAAPSDLTIKGKPAESQYFSSFQYDGPNNELAIFSKNTGRKIRFFDVPEAVAVGITNTYSFDMYYRFKLMDVYESTPDAREYIENL